MKDSENSNSSFEQDIRKTRLYRWLLIVATLGSVIGLSFYYILRSSNENSSNVEEVHLNHLNGIVQTISQGIDGDEFQALLDRHPKKDALTSNDQDPVYKEMQVLLQSVKDANKLQTDIYILAIRKREGESRLYKQSQFAVTSAETPYFRHPYALPMEIINNYEQGGKISAYESKNGTWVSAFAPVRNSAGEVVGIVEADVQLNEVIAQTQSRFNVSLVSILTITILILAAVTFLVYYITRNILRAQVAIRENFSQQKDTFEVLSQFAEDIGEGNFENDLTAIEAEENSLANSLMKMRENLYKAKLDEEKRSWTIQGVAQFADYLRSENRNIKSLSSTIISNLIKYLGANQGGIFVVNDEDEDDKPFLELTASYAYERQKFLKKRLEKGEGLVGQCWLEKDKIFMSEVPDDYVNITSGLGDANPRCILIVPLLLQEEFYGVIEIASFRVFEDHEVEFVERIAENIASTISIVKVNDRTGRLLAESQDQAERLQQQEEELRQNAEEMQATQEEMNRKIQYLESQISVDAEENIDPFR